MGLGLIMGIARDALSTQRYGVDVTANNIANANTPGYSRQRTMQETREPATVYGLLMGRGVTVTEISRSTDQFMEDRLMQQNSDLSNFQELSSHIHILENLFNENTDSSLSTMMSDYWNLWHDVANNPSGPTERIALYEHSVLMAEQFHILKNEMAQLNTDLTKSVRSAVERINEITGEVGIVNGQIVGIEASSSANDLRDKRNMLVSELAEYLDINTFEQSDGSLTIITAKGCVLAQGDSGYDLAMGGTLGDRVLWLGSGGRNVDISNYLNQGKLGGWLTMRDETLAKYDLDLDAFANKFIWSVNQQHSQGVGTKLFEPGTTMTGTYETSTDLGDLQFGNEIQFVANAFKLWIEDRSTPNSPVMNSVSIDLSGLGSNSTLSDLATAVNNQIAAAGLTGVTADGSGTALSLTSGSDYAFGFSEDVSSLLAAAGVNTFFQGIDATTIGMNSMISDKDYIAAALIDAGGNYAAGDNTNARATADLQITTMDISLWTCDRVAGNSEGSVTTTLEDYYHTMVGSIGTTASSYIRSRTFSESMVDRLRELRDSVSAVSLDEEMTNLIEYQHAFAAASKLVNTSDEMMDTLLGLK